MKALALILAVLVSAGLWGAAAWIVYHGASPDAHAEAAWMLGLAAPVLLIGLVLETDRL